jgi:hypothetical protein
MRMHRLTYPFAAGTACTHTYRSPQEAPIRDAIGIHDSITETTQSHVTQTHSLTLTHTQSRVTTSLKKNTKILTIPTHLSVTKQVVVLEARDRVGGRCWTGDLMGRKVDLGAGMHHTAA